MPKIVEQVLLRKQFTNPTTKKLESIYWGHVSPSEAARTKEYIDCLIVYAKVGSSPDVTIQKWLAQLPDEKHQKLSDVGLVKARSRMTLGAILDVIISKYSGQKNTYDIYLSSKDSRRNNVVQYFSETRYFTILLQRIGTSYFLASPKDRLIAFFGADRKPETITKDDMPQTIKSF